MTCPNCGGEDIIAITYGAPPLEGRQLAQAIEEKRIVMGGCKYCGDAPAWYCRGCGARFGDVRKKRHQITKPNVFSP